jgi:hypothetical protein
MPPPRDRHTQRQAERWERRRDRAPLQREERPIDTELFHEVEVEQEDDPPAQLSPTISMNPSPSAAEVFENTNSRRRQFGYWRMRDGRYIRIRDMEQEHLDNTIAMIQRSAETRGRRPSSFGAYGELITERDRRRLAENQPSIGRIAPPPNPPDGFRVPIRYEYVNATPWMSGLERRPTSDEELSRIRAEETEQLRIAMEAIQERERLEQERRSQLAEQQEQLRTGVNIPANLQIVLNLRSHTITIGENVYRIATTIRGQNIWNVGIYDGILMTILDPITPTEIEQPDRPVGRRIKS